LAQRIVNGQGGVVVGDKEGPENRDEDSEFGCTEKATISANQVSFESSVVEPGYGRQPFINVGLDLR
jgi:hypothetical protein